jgi:hypothetical protein
MRYLITTLQCGIWRGQSSPRQKARNADATGGADARLLPTYNCGLRQPTPSAEVPHLLLLHRRQSTHTLTCPTATITLFTPGPPYTCSHRSHSTQTMFHRQQNCGESLRVELPPKLPADKVRLDTLPFNVRLPPLNTGFHNGTLALSVAVAPLHWISAPAAPMSRLPS